MGIGAENVGSENVTRSDRPISRTFEPDTSLMTEYGIGFDGRSYWYQQYRYDMLDDALAYAQRDRSRLTGKPEDSGKHRWHEPEAPTPAQEECMAELGIVFDGRYYRYDGYRYDRFIDAINYAQLTHARPGTSPNG